MNHLWLSITINIILWLFGWCWWLNQSCNKQKNFIAHGAGKITNFGIFIFSELQVWGKSFLPITYFRKSVNFSSVIHMLCFWICWFFYIDKIIWNKLLLCLFLRKKNLSCLLWSAIFSVSWKIAITSFIQLYRSDSKIIFIFIKWNTLIGYEQKVYK